jgi:ABC-type transporter Mla subunit MlaD
MKRALVTVFVLALGAAYLVTTGAGGSNDARHFTVELDNAFGLVTGADLKIAGVRAGKITSLKLDRKTRHALVGFSVDKTGFGSLREDVFCETRPQSLIGEYFVDCRPGTSPKELPNGARIPVAQTATTIAPDLVNDILRRPYRERLRIILSELGVGVGARADELNDAIRRASPALRETNQVLDILGKQNLILRDLVGDADTVLHDLAGNRRDVTRWVREARGTAAASAERRRQIAEGLDKLPAFLEELQPTMAELGRAASAQTPTLVDLDASAQRLEHLFTQLKPFSSSSRVNLRSLAGAAKAGRPAIKAAGPVVDQLAAFSKDAPELANNLDIVLHDLDDRGRAIEKNPASPGGEGFTGFENLLQYVYNQAAAINIFDSHGYMLKVNAFSGECADYQNAKSLKEKLAEDPKFYERCASILGPNQQGITTPDPTQPANEPVPGKRTKKARRHKKAGHEQADSAPKRDDGNNGADARPPVDLGQTIQDLLGGKLPDLKLPDAPSVGDIGGAVGSKDPASDLLDFLLGP